MNERIIHRAFEIGIVLKALNSIIEIAGGIALYLVSTEQIVALVRAATQSELVGDRNDWVATHLLVMAESLSLSSKSFYAFYLLTHGVVKLGLAVGLLARKLWAYPASLAVFVLFIAYQLYRYSYTRSPGLLVLTAFDIIVLWLVWHEWRVMRKA